MRQFMTRVSDYLSEHYSDPERKEGRITIALIAIIAVIVIVMLLLILWGSLTHRNKGKEKTTENVKEEVTVVHKNAMDKYMASPRDTDTEEKLMTDITTLGEKTQSLEDVLALLQRELYGIAENSEGEDALLRTQAQELLAAVEQLLSQIQEIQTSLETATTLTESNNAEIQSLRTELNGLKEKWQMLESTVMEIDKSLQELKEKVTKLEAQNKLDFHYDKETNTLFLEPYQREVNGDER